MREIPPAPEKNSDHAVLQVAIQSRIKVFWRPAALRKKAGEKVELQLQVSQQGNQQQKPDRLLPDNRLRDEMSKVFSRASKP